MKGDRSLTDMTRSEVPLYETPPEVSEGIDLIPSRIWRWLAGPPDALRRWVMSFNGAPVVAASVVAVDVGKNKAALAVTHAARHRLFGPVEFAMTAPAVAAVVERVCVLCCRMLR
jgi:hypothetical protein